MKNIDKLRIRIEYLVSRFYQTGVQKLRPLQQVMFQDESRQ